jgi:hypothetical protein
MPFVSKAPCYVPVRDLFGCFNHCHFEGKIFVVFTGYIDESYDGEETPRMFSLTCTMTKGSEWAWIEMAWQKCIDEKNASLKKQGRKPIRRYHSVDLNNFRGDFSDWNGVERQEFCEQLMRVISRHILGYEGILINLQELIEEWPEATFAPKDFAYSVLLKFLMSGIGKDMKRHFPNEKMTLLHDRCEYDGVLLSAFNELMGDPTFRYTRYFTTIAPMGWEDCVPLQPADLMAYENFKEGYRRLPGKRRKRRKILDALISLAGC